MKTVDLFCGCGGFSLGFQNAGFEIIGAFDNWKPAAETYKANFTHPFYLMDVASWEALNIIRALKPEVIIGGPPCQDFSVCGKRNTGGARANLTLSFADIICDVKPAYFVMENVTGARDTGVYAMALKNMRSAGYGIETVILDASLCGVPQKRKRLFAIGGLNKSDISFRLGQIIRGTLAQKPLTVREYMGAEIDFEHYYRHPRQYNSRAIFSIDEPSATIRGTNSNLAPGYKGNSQDSAPLSPSIRAINSYERARIQTFPPGFLFKGNKGEIDQQIGNAVPVNIAKFVGDALKKYIAGA